LIQADAEGNFSLDLPSDIRFRAKIKDLMAIKSFINADTLHAEGDLTGSIKGRTDSLFVETKLKLSQVVYDANSIDSLTGDVTTFVGNSRVDGFANIQISNTEVHNFAIKNIHLEAGFTQSLVNIILEVDQGDFFRSHLKSKIQLDSVITINIPEISFDVKEQKWQGGSEDMEIVLGESEYLVRNFELASTANLSGHEQFILANGNISLVGDEDFELTISGIDLEGVSQILDSPTNFGGIYDMKINLKGTAEEPVIKSTLALSKGKLNNYEYETLRGDVNYLDDVFSWEFVLIPTASDSIEFNGKFPLHLSLTDTITVIKDEPLYIQLKSEKYPLTALKTGRFKVENVKGSISCNIEISGTMNTPEPAGFFRIGNGGFRIPEYGLNYENLNLGFSLNQSAVTLEKFKVQRDKGYLSASGSANFDSSLFTGNLKDFHFDLDAKDFFLVRHKHYEIQISAKTFLNGSLESPKFGGEITIPRSNFYLPALTGNKQAAKPPETALPRLMVERNKLNSELDSLGKTKIPKDGKEKSSPDIVKNLRGQLRVIIPKNTWIKSPEMRMELSGDIDLVKRGEDFEIFGPIRINRGHYDLFGRRFTIKDGSANFKGGAEINPDLKLEAEYVFRTSARKKRYLRLYVSGDLKKPVLNFTLDDTEISEGDAISYIVFGRSIDELTSGQRNDVSGGSEGIGVAGNLAANLLSSQLTKAVGGQFNLDYIEVKSDDQWESASFVVGKYLTNDLFVSYEKLIGQSQNDDTAKELVTAEYELTEFLFFQLMGGQAKYNGFDVIFKFNKQ
jgi:translocation and assembly module TamB